MLGFYAANLLYDLNELYNSIYSFTLRIVAKAMLLIVKTVIVLVQYSSILRLSATHILNVMAHWSILTLLFDSMDCYKGFNVCVDRIILVLRSSMLGFYAANTLYDLNKL